MQIPLAFLFGIPGGGEFLLIFVVILLMFGPKKLPEIARQIGKAMEYLRQTSQEFRDQVMRLDEEVPKAVDAAVNDHPTTSDLSGQNELPLGNSDQSQSADPYQIYQYPKVASSTPVSEEILTETKEIKPEEKNAAKIDSNTAVSPEEASGPKDPAASQEDKLAG